MVHIIGQGEGPRRQSRQALLKELGDLAVERLFSYQTSWTLAKEKRLEALVDTVVNLTKNKQLTSDQIKSMRIVINALNEQEDKGDFQTFKKKF